MRFKRHLSTTLSMPARHWTDQTASGRPAIACPSCGGIYELDETYVVRGAGVVTPIVSCPYVCPFIEYVTLAEHGEAVLR